MSSGNGPRTILSELEASYSGETHRAEGAYDRLNVLDAPHPWTIHRDRGAVAWRFNPQPAPRDQRGAATRRSSDRWRLLRLELFRLPRVAPQRAASRAALRPWAGIPRLRFARKASACAAWRGIAERDAARASVDALRTRISTRHPRRRPNRPTRLTDDSAADTVTSAAIAMRELRQRTAGSLRYWIGRGAGAGTYRQFAIAFRDTLRKAVALAPRLRDR
jgi:hypothetical protein